MRKFFILALSSMFFIPLSAAKRTVHTIGDSTMSDYKPAATPKRGWGMYLQAFFQSDSVAVNNRGKSGASTRTFYETEALWPSVKAQMKAGDYLIIQFAHNDEKCKGEDVYVKNADLRAQGLDTITDMRGTEPNTTYKVYLAKFIHEAREMDVTPILMAPICRAYFKDGKINDEGRHDLTIHNSQLTINKNYVQCMREVAEEMDVAFLDMTNASQELYERLGKEFCMAHYFNCGDKTHTSAEGGMAIATLAADLIAQSPDLDEMRPWMLNPSKPVLNMYAKAIEEKGKKAAFDAPGVAFSVSIKPMEVKNMKVVKHGYEPTSGAWPAGEIDEVANRYVEFVVSGDKKKGTVVESIIVPLCARNGHGMNVHINIGFGNEMREITTVYENTAMPTNKPFLATIEMPILIPGGEELHIRVLPWYDSNGKPQKNKRLELGKIQVKGKKLTK